MDVQVSGHFGPTGAVPSPLYVRANDLYAEKLGTLRPGHNLDIINATINKVNTVSHFDVSLRYGGAYVVDVFIKPR